MIKRLSSDVRLLTLDVGVLLGADGRHLLDGLLQRLQHLLQLPLLRVDEVQLSVQALLV